VKNLTATLMLPLALSAPACEDPGMTVLPAVDFRDVPNEVEKGPRPPTPIHVRPTSDAGRSGASGSVL